MADIDDIRQTLDAIRAQIRKQQPIPNLDALRLTQALGPLLDELEQHRAAAI